MIFLSSLPRSGSTLLTSLLNQRPDTYATKTSNLCDTMGAAVQAWEQSPTTRASGGKQEDLIRILKGMVADRYDTDKLVFDKGRGWSAPRIIKTVGLFQDVKIVATVRPIAECLASFVKLVKPDNVTAFCKSSELANHLFSSYHTLKAGYEVFPDKFLLIEYDNLVKDTQTQMDMIAEFVGQETFKHSLDAVPDSGEVDEVWGVKDLHKVRRKVSRSTYSVKRVLGKELYDFYQGGEFWNDKPEPVHKPSAIQKQHDALMAGYLAKSKKLAYSNLRKHPDNDDMAFNAGWAKLSDGKVQQGYKLLDRGRANMVWGDPHCGSSMPLWEGQENVTVLLRLERGLGDQIHQVRYARNLKALGCRVNVSCSSELSPVIRRAEGVDAVMDHRAACGVMHDYHLPAMSAPIHLGLTQETLDGSSYIKPYSDIDVVLGRIGLRWQGNPLYEHSTKRLFPPDLLFSVLGGRDCISLQKGEGSELRPRWIKSVPLNTWQDTMEAIASCEQVISSCTAIAHLAAAMGIRTTTIIPMVPYYLWTYPGSKTPYYDSMTLYRQTQPDNWNAPFEELSRAA